MSDAQQRELEYHEKLYSGFAQSHFARPAVRALRAHMVRRILALTGADKASRVLSLGCGIGDTELLLAPHVGEVTGIDLSPAAIRQARADAAALGIRNVRFEQATAAGGRFDVVIAIFFLHHLPDAELADLPHRLRQAGHAGGGVLFAGPQPSASFGRHRPPADSFKLMKRYQTDDERELEPEATAALFRAAGWETQIAMYDFGSSPLAGLFPGWGAGYRMARTLDDWVLRLPALARRRQQLRSNRARLNVSHKDANSQAWLLTKTEESLPVSSPRLLHRRFHMQLDVLVKGAVLNLQEMLFQAVPR